MYRFDGGPIHGKDMEVPDGFPFLTFRETEEDNSNGITVVKNKSEDRYAYSRENRTYRYQGIIKEGSDKVV